MAGIFERLKEGLKKTRENIGSALDGVIASFKRIDEDFLEELEEALIMADMGARTSMDLIDRLREISKQRKITETSQVKEIMQEIIEDMMSFEEDTYTGKRVILVVGVNGVGKTTTIGKLAYMYRQNNQSVLLAAGDTFRAAAAEQLEVWGKRADVNVIRHNEGADPSAVIFDAIQSAKAKNTDILICDTAGRLQTKKNLMEELKKIGRIINREFEGAKVETLLVLDATTGQNAVSQAKLFNEAVKIDSIVLTKMDGTAKGGIVLPIKNELGIPVKYIGIGEGIDMLQPFDAKEFAQAIF